MQRSCVAFISALGLATSTQDTQPPQKPSDAELMSASSNLQAGRLSPENLDLFQRAVHASPSDWRAHAMLGQAFSHSNDPAALISLTVAYALAPNQPELLLLLGAEHQKHGNLKNATAAFRAAIELAPSNANAYTTLGVLLASTDSSENAAGGDKSDSAAEAWSAAVSLAPQNAEAQHLLAARLAAGAASQRQRAIKHAKRALKLAPTLAAASDAMAAALLTGGLPPANLTKTERKLMMRALSTSIQQHSAAAEEAHGGGRGGASSELHTKRIAYAHYQYMRLLVSDDGLDGDTSVGAQAVHHLREAARLQPAQYGVKAAQLEGWEDAERLSKEADRRSRLDRVKMVDAMKAAADEKRLTQEEDAAVAAEEREEERQEAEALAARRTQTASTKSELR